MATFTDADKEFVVKRLARFDSPSEVRKALKKVRGTEASRSQIAYYNPGNEQGRDLAQKWRDLFEATREQYISDTSRIASSHKAHRLRRLEEAAEDARKHKNWPLMADIYEQIAKELGGAYTNERKHDHTSDGQRIGFVDFSPPAGDGSDGRSDLPAASESDA